MLISGLRTLFSVALVASWSLSFAQQPVSAHGTGTVSGHVTCGDTQRPARFADVVLFAIPTQVTTAAKIDPTDQAGQIKAMTDALASMGKINMVQAQTGTDGSFTATDVAPGDYYVFASSTGYVAPLKQVQALIDAGADTKKSLPGIPMVHVVAEHAAMAEVSMQRGAAISGTIRWDDGSPVTGAIMSVVAAKGDPQPPTQFRMLALSGALGSFSISDDLGHYRISSLPPGDYVVKATIRSGQQSGLGTGMNLSKMMAATPLAVYAPAAFHQADAKPVTLHTAEDLGDELITLNLGGLHSVSGRIASAVDHHGLNAATVKLQDTQDKDFIRSAAVDAAGGFTVTFVPPGTYTMKVTDAEDTEPARKTDKPKLFAQDKTLRSYQDGQRSVIVLDSDLTAQDLELPLEKDTKKPIDAAGVIGSMLSDDDDDKPASPK